ARSKSERLSAAWSRSFRASATEKSSSPAAASSSRPTSAKPAPPTSTDPATRCVASPKVRMLQPVLRFSIEHRFLVVMFPLLAAGLGVWSLQRLPIDAVPDITNNQVQINTLAPALSPVEIEKQVTFPVETALAGIPGLQTTRSLSRNGFSQVQAVFEDDVDIYFARQQVNERLTEARENLPPGADPMMGPISTGLGEVYMWTVEYEHPEGKGAPTPGVG